MGSDAKSYMSKAFLIYEGKCANISPYMRRTLVTYDFAPDPSEFPFYMRKISFSFYQCANVTKNRHACLICFFARLCPPRPIFPLLIPPATTAPPC